MAKSFLERRYSEVDLSDNPDFAAVAEVFGVQGFTVDCAAEVSASIDAFLACEGPALLHVKLDQNTNVWPFVPPGRSNSVMLEGT